MNTREADEFFEAFELANDQGTVSWGNISVSADAWIKQVRDIEAAMLRAT
jgi:hypothetical protein